MNVDFSVLFRDDYLALISKGLGTMFQLTLCAWLLAMVLGTFLAMVRMTPSRPAQLAVAVWVEYHQNVPMLVQIFLWYFGIAALLPQGLQFWANKNGGELIFSIIAVGLAMSAYISEDLRGGIRSIPKSQLEAARALGLSYWQAFTRVVLPQAVRIALPTLINHSVLLFKNTSLAMAIGVVELTYVTREIESQTFKTVEIYLFATAVYLGISLLLMAAGSLLERRMAITGR